MFFDIVKELLEGPLGVAKIKDGQTQPSCLILEGLQKNLEYSDAHNSSELRPCSADEGVEHRNAIPTEPVGSIGAELRTYEVACESAPPSPLNQNQVSAPPSPLNQNQVDTTEELLEHLARAARVRPDLERSRLLVECGEKIWL